MFRLSSLSVNVLKYSPTWLRHDRVYSTDSVIVELVRGGEFEPLSIPAVVSDGVDDAQRTPAPHAHRHPFRLRTNVFIRKTAFAKQHYPILINRRETEDGDVIQQLRRLPTRSLINRYAEFGWIIDKTNFVTIVACPGNPLSQLYSFGASKLQVVGSNPFRIDDFF